MSDALKVINNIRTLRAQARELTLDTLKEMLEKLTIVVEERREEEASFLKQQEEKQAKLEAFRQKLLSTLYLNRNDHNKTCYNRSSD